MPQRSQVRKRTRTYAVTSTLYQWASLLEMKARKSFKHLYRQCRTYSKVSQLLEPRDWRTNNVCKCARTQCCQTFSVLQVSVGGGGKSITYECCSEVESEHKHILPTVSSHWFVHRQMCTLKSTKSPKVKGWNRTDPLSVSALENLPFQKVARGAKSAISRSN